MAFLIFGRFHESPIGSLKLAGLVLVGGGAEVLFLSLVRWPPAFRTQRDALSAGFRALAASVHGGSGPTTVAAGTELDRVVELLSAPGLFGRDDERSLRGIVDEARRMRVEMAALASLRRRAVETGRTDEDAVHAALDRLVTALEKAANAIDLGRPDPSILADTEAIDLVVAGLISHGEPGPTVSLGHHLQALGGQLRAVERLLGQRADPRWHLSGQQGQRWQSVRRTWVEQARQVRANLTLASPAMRHALRLGVAVPASDVLSQLVGLPRSYWVPLTVAVVLRPDFGALFSRGVGRVVGTCVGVGVTGFILAEFHPQQAIVIALLGLAAWGTYALFQSNFAVAGSFVAATILLLLSVTQVNTSTTAVDRVLDTLLGGAVALAAYLVWPTWSNGQTRRALSRLVTAQRSYLWAIISIALGDQICSREQLVRLARGARLTWMEAEATTARSLAEPTKWRVDGDVVNSLMAALLRLIQSAHALRLEASGSPVTDGTGALRALADGMDTALDQVTHALEQNAPLGELPQLRTLQDAMAGSAFPPALQEELDELVNVINTIGDLLRHRQLEPAPA
jgi:uncharacterized membrane protein YccC